MSAVLPERAGGLAREEAAALTREVSRTSGYRGTLQRLAGGSPSGDAWAVRVTAILGGPGGLLRSREAWERYRVQPRHEAQEARRMVGLVETRDVGAQNGTGAPDLDGDVDEVQMTHSFEEREAGGGPPTGPHQLRAARAARESPLDLWRRFTEQAIADEEREADRMLVQADRLRERATQARQDARRLRRALAVGAPPDAEDGAGGDGSIRSRVLAWARAHGGELRLSACADALGLSIKRASDAASQLRADGRLLRVGKGLYRQVPPDATAHTGAAQEEEGA